MVPRFDRDALAQLLLYMAARGRDLGPFYFVLALAEGDPVQSRLRGMLRFSSPMVYFLAGLDEKAVQALAGKPYRLPYLDFATM